MKPILSLLSLSFIFLLALVPKAKSQGVFFSEYTEGSSGNNKALEIYNGTGSTISLSNYKIVLANNGGGFGNGNGTDIEPYEITLSGSLEAGDVFVLGNGQAVVGITSVSDILLSFGNNPGDRVVAFNGNDALGLYENGSLVDVFGDPNSSDTWTVGSSGSSANLTLRRKSNVTNGNITPLGSFGTTDENSEWEVFPDTDYSNLGFHVLDGVTNPLIITDLGGFIGNFGLVAFPATSGVASYKISASDLTADLVVTPPVGFEINLSSDFSGTTYTSTSALTISPTDGIIAETNIYVRFKPTAADGATYTGDITHTNTDADSKSISVTGFEGVPTNDLFISQYLEPASGNDKAIEIYNNSGDAADLSNYTLEIYVNGSSSASTILTLSDITPTLAIDDVLAIANSNASPEVLALANSSTSSVFNFNGDDALVLKKNGRIIDLFGETGVDPGSFWDVGNGEGTTQDHTLVRKPIVGIGNTTSLGSFGTSSETSEWIVLNPGDFTGLGSHEIINEGDPVITIDKTGFDASFGQVITNATSASSSYSISAINLTADITITAPTDFALSNDGTTYASTLTIPHVDGGVAATTIHVTFTPTTVGSFSDVINHESGDAISQTVTVSGVGLDPSTIIFEDFTDCIDLNTFTSYSVTGDEVWECSTSGETGSGTRISGFASGAAQINEDWLVSSAIDLSELDATAILTFVTDVRFDGPLLEVYASSNFTTDVTTATWDKLDALVDTDADNNDTWTNSGDIFLDDYLGGNVYIGFKYTSETTLGAAQWSIDNFTVNASPFRPFFKVNFSGFNGDFGLTNVGTTSQATSFAIEGNLLTDDVTITPPSQFEVSTSTDFTTQGTTATPLVVTPAEGAVDVTVYVRYVPTAEGEASGNIIVSTTGYDAETAEVNGSGKIVLSLDSDLTFSVYPNPVMNQLQVSTTGDDFEGMILDLSGVLVKSFSTNKLDVSTLKAGIYILRIKDLTGAMIHQQRIIKY